MSGAATTRVDVEEIQTTRSEKLLAVVLAVFLLIGGLWTYDRLADWSREAFVPEISAADEAAVHVADVASARAYAAAAGERRALDEHVVAREAYPTALEARGSAVALRGAYESRPRAYRLCASSMISTQSSYGVS